MTSKIATALGVMLLGAVVAAQSPDRAKLIQLANAGKAPEAWKLWTALPNGPDKTRLGVEIAAAAKQIARGVELYTQLTSETKAPDAPALRTLTIAAATDLLPTPDVDARMVACGGALMLDPAHAPCRKALDTIASNSEDPGQRALASYTMANAGVPGAAATASANDGSLRKDTRVRLAQTMTRLPAAERVRLLQPLFDDADMATQYQAVLILAIIPGGDALAAARNLRPQGPARMAALVALGTHGDKTALDQLATLLGGMSMFEKIQTARALVEALDERGVAVLEEALRSPVDLERIQAAEALARINPDQALRSLRESLNGGSPAVQPAALRAAGVVRMGTDAAVYRKLSSTEASVRSEAILAIAETLVARPPVK